MPEAAIRAGVADRVLPIEGIAAALTGRVHRLPERRPMTRILIVDDRPENLLALAAVLESVPAEIVTASSGEEALRRLLEGDYAVVLLDVQMPGMDGFEVAEYAKRLERTRYTPIIFLTARDADAENVARGYETGAVDFVVKPYEPAILRSKVAVFVELHEKTVALEASERRFKTAFEDAPIGVGLLGLDGRWLAVNRALCEIAGRPAARCSCTATGATCSTRRRATRCRCPATAAAHARPSAASGAPTAASRDVLVSTSAVHDADGAALHHLVMANDVTAHREAEAKAAAMAAQAMVHEAERNAQAEIAAAHRTLLQTLLPTIRPGIPVRAFYRPGDARLLLGGDFYDCLVDGAGRLRMVLGDVSGHGPAAAGLGAALRVAWRALAEAGTDDADLPAGLERVLEAERPDPDMFATICCATLEAETRVLRFVSAGHPAPRDPGRRAAPGARSRRHRRSACCRSSSWPVHEVELQPERGRADLHGRPDRGTRRAVGSQERFGVDRLLELVAERRLAASPEELESVIREIARVGGGLPDDVAALILLPATKATPPAERRRGPGGARRLDVRVGYAASAMRTARPPAALTSYRATSARCTSSSTSGWRPSTPTTPIERPTGGLPSAAPAARRSSSTSAKAAAVGASRSTQTANSSPPKRQA